MARPLHLLGAMSVTTARLRAAARYAKLKVLHALKVSGTLRRVADSEWRRQRLLILCYHGISLDDEHEWKPQLYVSPERLRARLDMLAQAGSTVLPLGQALEACERGDLPRRSVAITFDDGAHDFYERAFPLLQAYGFPGTVYLTTYYCQRRLPIYNLACSYLLWKARRRTVSLQSVVRVDETFALDGPGGYYDAWIRMLRVAEREGYSATEKHEAVERLAAELQVDLGPMMRRRMLHIMAPHEVQELAAHGLDVQLHTHRHRTPNERTGYLREIQENRAVIEQLTNRPAAHFCYPNGKYAPEFLPWLEEAHVASGVTCDPGLVTASTPRLALPRFIDTMRTPDVMFEGWVSGAAAWFPQRTYA